MRSFDSIFDEMESALWVLAKAARADLTRAQPSSTVEGLVWTVKSWWGIQGVRSEVKVLMSKALAAEEWSIQSFDERIAPTPEGEQFAIDRVSQLVTDTLERGAKRQEFSLASKVLHWLMPWRIPVYDSFVRKATRVPSALGHLDAYRRIVQWEFDAARRSHAAAP